MRSRERAWAEPRFPPSIVDGWQLTVTKASWHLGASGQGPAVEAAGRAAMRTLERERERERRLPLLLLSAANHVSFGFSFFA